MSKDVLTAFRPPSGGGGGSAQDFVVIREATCARTLLAVLLSSPEARDILRLSAEKIPFSSECAPFSADT